MIEIVNKFLLTVDKYMPEMHLKQPALTYSAPGPLLKIHKELKNLKRQVIQIISTKMILIKLVLSMIWLMVNIKI